jgi:hypothetical protein
MLPLSVTYAQVTDAAAALSKIAGGYSLSVTGVAAADASALADNAKVSSMSVTGTNLTIAANLSSLHALGKKVANIQQSNAGVALALTADQWQNQAATLNKIVGGFNAVVSDVSAGKAQLVAADDRVNSISVKDTGVNIENHLDTLQALGSPLTQIEQTDNASLSLTANQWALNQGVLAKYKTGTSPTVVVTQLSAADAKSVSDDERVSLVKIIDTSENVATNISALQVIASQATPKLGAITLRGSDALVMSYQKRADSGAALAKINSNYALSITGATAEQAASLEDDNKVVSIAVADSAANISSKLAQLHGLGNKLRKVQLSIAGAPIALTSAQWSTKTATLNKIEGGYTATVSGVAAAKASAVLADSHVVSLQVKDNLLNISNQLTALQALGRQVSEIEQTDVGRLTVSANDWISNKTALDKVTTSSSIAATQANAEFSITQASLAWFSASGSDTRVKAIAIKDTAENVSLQWEAIKGSSKITGLDLTSISNALNLSAELIGNSTSTLSKINGNYLINATSANIAQAQTLLSDSHVQAIDVLDSRANVNTSFDQLDTNTKVRNIYLNNNDAPVSLSQSQVLGGLTTLNKFQSSYTLDVSGVSVANVVNFAETLPIHNMNLTATSDEVSIAMDDLSAIEGKLAGIEVTDGGDELIELSYQQFQENGALLAKISSAYQLAVNNVAADAALTIAATQVNSVNTVSALSVSDTVNNVKLNLESLKTIGDALKIITVTDEEAMVLTQSEFDNYSSVLDKILGYINIDIE